MNEQELNEAIRSLAAENAATPVPPEIGTRVMAAFDARNTGPARTGWWLPAMAAFVAAVLFAAFLWHRPTPGVHVTATRPREAPFVAIPYVAPPAPYERTEVKRMNLPLAALIAAGLEVHATNTGSAIPAEVLVGQDGRPLAIRLLKNVI